jgi:hypothetical protein
VHLQMGLLRNSLADYTQAHEVFTPCVMRIDLSD